jgi:hypothetical protein
VGVDTDRRSDDTAGPLVASARGWHGVQLAALAFIGLCGVLSGSDPEVPRPVQVAAGVLALVALALACAATFVVATVAWPLPSGRPPPGRPSGTTGEAGPVATSGPSGRPGTIDLAGAGGAGSAARRLRAGVALTFVAVAVMALAASAGWWPVGEAGGGGDVGATEVRVTVRGGGTACGRLADAPAGIVRLVTDDGSADVAVGRLTTIAAVDGC